MGYEKPKDYVEVKDRVVEFRAKHPEGSLQSDPIEWVRDEDNKIIGLTVQARAYRSPDDPRPGVGTAFEFYPGKTPYTKGSEAQNAETSAWGRALIAVGAADASKGIASADEVRRVRGEATISESDYAELSKLLSDKNADPTVFRGRFGVLRDLPASRVAEVRKWVNGQ